MTFRELQISLQMPGHCGRKGTVLVTGMELLNTNLFQKGTA